jgi:NADPH-dependent glutamate synthase beta subunit-like oxidoreductase
MLKEEVIENMKKIVSECMGEENPACVTNCPMHTDVKEYIRLLREGKGEEALLTIREKLFLPGTLGRICAHPCEGKCKINEINSPMSIAGLKRYIADNFDREELWNLEKKEKNGKKVAVIGAGPSGLQSALDLIRKGYEVIVFEKLPVKGGMMAVGIPEYRLPRDILAHEISYLEKLGVEFKMNCEIGKDIPMKDIVNNFDAVIVAVGKHRGRTGTDIVSSSIYSAGDFLRTASLEREKLSLGEKVLVIGGGDVAMDCARTSIRIKGVKEVYSACLEGSFDEMTASKEEVKGAYDEGINFYHGQGIKEIVISDNKIQNVKLKKCLSLFDENKNFAPVYNENKITDLKADTIIFAIGQAVDGDFADGILTQRRNTTFECDPATLQSRDNKKIFITGDASGESVIVIQAMATGRRAAESVDRFLQNKDLLSGRNIEDTKSYDTKLVREINWEDIKERRLEINELDPKERIKSFAEVSLGYTKEQAQYEADRCRQCECRLCMKECMMLKNFTSCPKELFRNYLEKGYQEMDKMIAFSCNECSQCTIKCPKDLDLKTNFIEMRKEYIKDNGGKQIIESFVDTDRIQMMECSREYCTTLIQEKNLNMFLFQDVQFQPINQN